MPRQILVPLALLDPASVVSSLNPTGDLVIIRCLADSAAVLSGAVERL